MGIFTNFAQKKKQRESVKDIPRTKDLLYPGELPEFEEIEAEGHADTRALVYAVRHIDPARRRPLTDAEFDAGDFDNRTKTIRALRKRGLVSELPREKELEARYEKAELKRLLREKGLPVGGNKPELAARLAGAGFLGDRGKRRGRLYELTGEGAREIVRRWRDHQEAEKRAAMALKGGSYERAIGAYRDFDNRWGFIHRSGKAHTIFAHYDIPREQFTAMEQYSMDDLLNTEDFKRTLRACMIAGMMRGCREKEELAGCFADLCEEPIRCPDLMEYYEDGDFGDGKNEAILARMEENIARDSRAALEYYIAHIMHDIRGA